MPQFDYQQLCHFVLPEQGGLSVETILKRFLHLTPREIRHAKYIPDGIQKNGVSCRTNAVVQTGDTITFRYAQKCPHLSEDQVLPVSVILPAYGFSMRTVISVSQTSHPVWSATLPTAIIPIP